MFRPGPAVVARCSDSLVCLIHCRCLLSADASDRRKVEEHISNLECLKAYGQAKPTLSGSITSSTIPAELVARATWRKGQS